MADLVWPEGLIPYKTMFYLQAHTGGQESPLTRTRKVYGLSAPRWVARLTFRAGHGYDRNYYGGTPGARKRDPAFYAARLDALIAQLQGGLHCIRFHDFRRPIPQGHLSAYTVGLIDEAMPGATTITVRKNPGEVGPTIGDYIGCDGRPHIVTDVSGSDTGHMTAIADDDGVMQIHFQPPLSYLVLQDTPLEVGPVTARFRLTSDDAGQNEGEVGSPIEYGLEFIEDLIPEYWYLPDDGDGGEPIDPVEGGGDDDGPHYPSPIE